MAKRVAENSNRLSIFLLRKEGMLNTTNGMRYGTIIWRSNRSEAKDSIGYSVMIGESNLICLQYSRTDSYTGDKESLDYPIQLTSTECNYGGKRYWFTCPIINNGARCGRRVGILYLADKYFACRWCSGVIYYAQSHSRTSWSSTYYLPDIEKLEGEIKRCFYRGKPTRKYRRMMRMKSSIFRSYKEQLLKII